MTDPGSYFLTEQQLRGYFDEYVRGYVFDDYQPQAKPVLVLLGGQPAAGKSHAMAEAVRRHNGTVVPLTGDDLRPFHPRYKELLAEDAQTRETATAQFSGAMVRMSIEHALHNGYGLLLEGVFRDPAMTIGTAEQFAKAGRPVEVVALAVREERSRLDALGRFLEGGRWTPPALQDLAYGKVPETIAAAEQSPAVVRISVTNRSGADLYSNDRGRDGLWPGGPGAVPALENERKEPLTSDEAALWLAKYRTVLVEMAARGETNDKSRPVLRRLTEDAEAVAAMAADDPGSPVRERHEAVGPLLNLLVEQPLAAATDPVPLALLPTLPSTPQGREEARRRDGLPPAARSAEDELRTALAAARRGHQGIGGATQAAPRRPDPNAARARSTTTRGRPSATAGPRTPPAAASGPHPSPPEQRRGRGR